MKSTTLTTLNCPAYVAAACRELMFHRIAQHGNAVVSRFLAEITAVAMTKTYAVLVQGPFPKYITTYLASPHLDTTCGR